MVDEDLTHAGPALTQDPGTNNSMKDVSLCLVSTPEPTQDRELRQVNSNFFETR